MCPSLFVFPLCFLVANLITTTGSLDRTRMHLSLELALASGNLNTSDVGKGSWFREQGCSVLEGLCLKTPLFPEILQEQWGLSGLSFLSVISSRNPPTGHSWKIPFLS